MTVVYDAGALIAADRSDRQLWADHLVRLQLGLTPLTTAPVVAQVSRSGRQVQLRRFLRGCRIQSFAPEISHEVGVVAGRSTTPDVVDVHLVIVATRAQAAILTSDRGDIERVAAALADPPAIIDI